MKIKTSELTGAALDWIVAKLEGVPVDQPGFDWEIGKVSYHYSLDWELSGPLIEREGISIVQQFQLGQGNDWVARLAWLDEPQGEGFGPTPLIAAMRCYVASKLGDEVDVPGELLCKS